MSLRRQLLERLVDAYDHEQRPVQPGEVAERLDADVQRIRDCLADLRECSLVARADGGFRPTVTARELLALDVDGDLLVVDPDPEAARENDCDGNGTTDPRA